MYLVQSKYLISRVDNEETLLLRKTEQALESAHEQKLKSLAEKIVDFDLYRGYRFGDKKDAEWFW